MRECCVLHHHAVSLKIAGLLETVWSLGSTQCVSVCARERFCTVRIHSQLVKVYGTHVRSQKQVWMWCRAFSHGRTHGQHVTIRTPKQMTMSVMQMPVIRKDRCIKLTNVAQDLDISLCSVQCCPPPAELLKSVCTLCAQESHGWYKSCTLTGMLIKENSSAVKCLQWQDYWSSRLDSYIHCHRWQCMSCRCSFQRGQTAQELCVLLANVHSIVWTMGLQKSLCTVSAKGPHRHKTLHYTFDTLSDKDSRDCSALLQQMKHV